VHLLHYALVNFVSLSNERVNSSCRIKRDLWPISAHQKASESRIRRRDVVWGSPSRRLRQQSANAVEVEGVSFRM
jgi:hypothetical protein